MFSETMFKELLGSDYLNNQRRSAIIERFLVLDKRRQEILRLRFQYEYSLDRIAAKFDLTQGRISQLISDSITKMKHETR